MLNPSIVIGVLLPLWCKDPVQVAANNSKYIKLKVGNFMNSVDLMLFDKAFQKTGKSNRVIYYSF